MTEREFTIARLKPVLERLKQLGVEPPAPPDSDGNEFSDCQTCKGVGSEVIDPGSGQKVLCAECLGSGQIVTNRVFDWQRQVGRLLQEAIRKENVNRSQRNI